MPRYLVTRTTVETIVVQDTHPGDAVDKAMSYECTYDWSEQPTTYSVQEVDHA